MIVVDNVTKFYGAHAAVRDLTFRIEEGECVGFLGLNGAGKTTTLRILSCLSLPTSGRVAIRGLDIEENPHEIRKLIGFLPDTPPVYPEMRVSSYLRFAGKLREMESKAVEARLPQVMETCGLTDVKDEVIATLSHGYRQRVGIAQAIVHDPTLLILDEPIQGLDPVQIVEMREMIRSLRGRHTILLSTHILGEIRQTCDRIMMLHQGRITAQGSEDDLATRFAQGIGVEVEVRLAGTPADLPAGYRAPPDADETLRKVVSSVDGVTEVAVTVGVEADQRVVRLSATRDVRAEVARALVGADYRLLRLERAAEGLEGIFVQLSKGGTA
jgi:ABC-2 type transport system ATP-binding protein